jgi:hypothetical protein
MPEVGAGEVEEENALIGKRIGRQEEVGGIGKQ